jgi:Icc-related predicted phosphoesterase
LEVKILALADEPCRALWDFDTKKGLAGIDLILSCGDLPADYLEYLTNFTTAPILYVHGNHDGKYVDHEPGGCICIDDQVYTWRGLRILGLGGCMRYNLQSTYQYTEKEMEHRIRRLQWPLRRAKGFDLLLAHSPALGLNDGSDPAHRGFACFNQLLDTYTPGWFVHGHVHLQYNCCLPRVCTHGATTVINASERYLFEIPDEMLKPKEKPPGTFFLKSIL